MASVVRERLAPVEVVDVDVREGMDSDSDSVIFVRIVFDADVHDLDVHRVIGLTRHIRNGLSHTGETMFLHPRLIALSDTDGAAALSLGTCSRRHDGLRAGRNGPGNSI